MKKGSNLLLLICGLSLCVVLGIFIGRNLRGEYVELPKGSAIDTVAIPETTEDFRLDINTASKAQLIDLPGIGERIAERIIAYRTENGPFRSIDDLLNVDGIGHKKLSQIEAQIKAGG